MKAAVGATVLLLAVPWRVEGKAAVTPTEKVLAMLGTMRQQAKDEKLNEAHEYEMFKLFCDDTTAEYEKTIEKTKAQIEMLEADIGKAEAEAERLGKEIKSHEADIADWKADIKNATEGREVQKVDYEKQHMDYSESVAALQGAIAELKRRAHDTPGAAALLQSVRSFKIPEVARRQLDAFLSEEPGDDIVLAPEADAYQFQSEHIITMLEKLLDKFRDEKAALEKQEMANQHAYDMLMQDLTDSVKAAERAVASKSEEKAAQEEAAVTAKGDLTDATQTLADDEAYLTGLKATCAEKASDFKARQKLRADEIEALGKAIEVIEGKVKENAETYLPKFVQERGAASFAQLRGQSATPNLEKVAEFLTEQAQRLDSRVLAAIAMKAEKDPFAKVKKLIEELITRLMSQATEEAEQKGWCDESLAVNKHTREEKAAAVERLRAEIDELTAAEAKLADEIADLTQQVEELDASVAKATEIRDKEHHENTKTIEDAKVAQEGVSMAIEILKDFYAQAAKATSLAQLSQKGPEPPKIFEKPYKGMQGESKGVIGMLEVIHSDFARLEAETTTEEAAAAKAHQKFLKEAEIARVQKDKDITHKTTEQTNMKQAVSEKNEDLDSNQQQLDLAMQSYEKLKPACLDVGQTYEERVARREEEIEALKEALKILSESTGDSEGASWSPNARITTNEYEAREGAM